MLPAGYWQVVLGYLLHLSALCKVHFRVHFWKTAVKVWLYNIYVEDCSTSDLLQGQGHSTRIVSKSYNNFTLYKPPRKRYFKLRLSLLCWWYCNYFPCLFLQRLLIIFYKLQISSRFKQLWFFFLNTVLNWRKAKFMKCMCFSLLWEDKARELMPNFEYLELLNDDNLCLRTTFIL